MDDFNVTSLHESKNEWCSRLLIILTPHIIDGFRSVFDEALGICKKNDEHNKYLMTFQNFISRIPKWNPTIVETEKERIIERSGCHYLEDLITCVYVIQLKLLSAARAGNKQKKIDIDIPKLEDFIHKVYIQCARKIYANVYLFESMPNNPLLVQKNNRELELIIQDCILNTIREGVPIEAILNAYMDESIEEDVEENIKEEIIHEDVEVDGTNTEIISEESNVNKSNDGEINIGEDINSNPLSKQLETELSIPTTTSSEEYIPFPELTNAPVGSLSFNNVDYVKDSNNKESEVSASKDINRLEQISDMRYSERKTMEDDDDDDNDDNYQGKLHISNEDTSLGLIDVHNLDGGNNIQLNTENMLGDIEILA